MKLTILVGRNPGCAEVEYFAVDSTVCIDQVISEVVKQLSLFQQFTLRRAESVENSIFLTKTPADGPKLHGTLTLDRLGINQDSKLWLYCAKLQ